LQASHRDHDHRARRLSWNTTKLFSLPFLGVVLYVHFRLVFKGYPF
jgi:hypothetical protein